MMKKTDTSNQVSTAIVLLASISLLLTESSPSNCPRECHQPDDEEAKSTPVCASNGIEYPSLCHMLKDNCGKNVTVSGFGPCQNKSIEEEKSLGDRPNCPSKCLDINDPVCGDDGHIYLNKCWMLKQNCGKSMAERHKKYCWAKNRQARKHESCPSRCFDHYSPVCGSDKKLYLNECLMRQRNCGQTVKEIPISECVKVKRCPERCLAIYDPVCGSDGNVYLNHCRMSKASCEFGSSVIKPMAASFCVGEEGADRLR